jgi:hypothetical protein
MGKIKVSLEIEISCEDEQNLEAALTKILTTPNKMRRLIKHQNSSIFTNSISVYDKYTLKTERIN